MNVDPNQNQPQNPTPQGGKPPENRRAKRNKAQKEADTEARLMEESIAATNRMVEAGARSAVMIAFFSDDKIVIGSHDHLDISNAMIERAFNERMAFDPDDEEDE